MTSKTQKLKCLFGFHDYQFFDSYDDYQKCKWCNCQQSYEEWYKEVSSKE